MKKTLFILLVSLSFFNSCLACLSPQIKESKKTIEIVKKSYLENYSKKTTIEETFNRVSNNNCKWGATNKGDMCKCQIWINYPHPTTFQTLTFIYIFTFQYDKDTNKVNVKNILEIYNRNSYREYRESVGIAYVLNKIYFMY